MARILWLHNMGDPRLWRSSVASLETMLERHSQGHDVLVLDSRLPLAKELGNCHWDAIFLGPTFLCNRYDPSLLASVESRFGWIANSTAVKVALPQDDYDCSAILDEWLVRWNVDVCYSPLPEWQWILYPAFSQIGEIRSGYTGYVDDRWIEQSSQTGATSVREIDVFYRASRLPANFGSLGQLKSQIADRFTDTVSKLDLNLTLDISCNERDTIAGDEWHRRLGDSKFTLASPSGSSLLDPVGVFRNCVSQLPGGVSFEDAKRKCFPNDDNVYNFEAIGPRHIEAALWGTVQIAVEGNYSQVLEPRHHYLTLDRDLSNIPEVIESMKDPILVAQIQASARERVLGVKRLQLGFFASELIAIIPPPPLTRNEFQMGVDVERPISGLRTMSVRQSSHYWRRRRWMLLAVRAIKFVGLGAIARGTYFLFRRSRI